MRHAKSSWDFPDLDDHDRPLNKRGVNSAKLICEFFIKKKLKIDLVYCSSSKRTMQTLNILSEKISFKKIIKKKALYHASEDEIIHILKQTGDNYKTLLLINHEHCQKKSVLKKLSKKKRFIMLVRMKLFIS